MKKLSLLLLTLCVSLAGWANESDPYRLNPFAYDLSSSWDEASQKLTLRFKVNSVPNLEDKNGWSCGIQVFAVDSRETRYYIWGTPGNTIREAHNGGAGTYEYVADLSSGRDLYGNLIPRNEDLTWMVRVAGRGDGNSTPVTPGNGEPVINYTLPRFWNFQNSFSDKRYISPSIAVNTSPETPNFGDIYIIDNMNPSNHTASKWTSSATGRGIYVYKPDFKTKAYSGNKVAIDPAAKAGGFVDTSEPRDLCVSKDGRVFVCSYSTASTVAVWELKNNYTTWTPILNKEDITKKVTGGTTNKHSVVSMDVKGEGDDITLLLLCKGTTKNNNNKDFPLLKCVEYNVSTETLTEIQLPQQIYDFVYYNEGINAHARIAYDDTNNWIWCGFGTNANKSWVRAFDPTIANDNNNVNKNLKVNETIGDFWGGEAFCVKGNMLIKSIQFTTYNRPSIIFRTIDRSKTDVTAVITDDPCFTYNGDVQNSILDADFATDCYNDFALDYANNLYVANNWSGQVFPISLPYDGIKDTPAPSNQKFRLPLAVPNILATDLTYAPYGNENKYKFSFNVNTKPELAQIRFYANEADMLANNGNYSFYYEFSEAERKQGRMSVIFDAVGGTIGDDKLLNDPNGNGLRNLPRGEYYWNVYVKTRESNVFAPIYTQPNTGDDVHHRLHATIDNNPNNKGFGHIYASNYDGSNNTLMVYSIGDGNVIDQSANINSSKRHALIQKLTTDLKNTRRPAVAPDGTVFLTDHGNGTTQATNGPSGFEHGGIYVFDPTTNKQASGNAQLTRFFSDNEVTTGVSFYGTGANTILYKTNTYDEFTNHPGSGANSYQDEKWMRNGYRIFNVGNANGSIKHAVSLSESTLIPFVGTYEGKKYGGDASGNISMKATADGVWFCQHREGTVEEGAGLKGLKDNFENVALMFYNKNNQRAFESYKATVNGKSLSQTESSIMQSTPGAGMTVSPDEKYLYVVNHEGNILEFQIGGTSNAKTLTHTRTYLTDYKAISSLNFDYAGNLVATAFSVGYPTPNNSNIVIYTMPYPNQENARAIPASEAFRLLPERVAHLDMGARELELIIQGHEGHGCAIDLYRPLQGVMFNTICLPFELNLGSLPADHPLKDATLKQYTGLNLNTVGGEKVLELEFDDVESKIIAANQPYIIQPPKDIPHIISFDGPLVLTRTTGDAITWSDTEDDKTYSITHRGIIPFQYVEPKKDQNTGEILTLILVADNRLAAMTSAGNMLGFRGYFQLNQPLPKGMQTRITTSKGTTTNTTIVVDGKKVNVEKYLQEGRVYIRVGESLYTLDGQKVE